MTTPPRAHRQVSADTLRFALVTIGIVLLAYAGALQMDWLSTSGETLPAPMALQLTTPLLAAPALEFAPVAEAASAPETGASDAEPAEDPGQAVSSEHVGASAGVRETSDEVLPRAAAPPAWTLAPASVQGPLSSPGVANWLSIPAIDLEASVVPGGTVPNAAGEPEWQTLPFVAVHYADDTALVGASDNAVIAGHVVTLSQGNVFRNLYRVVPGNRIAVQVQSGATFTYQVSSVQLVSPSAVEVMQERTDPELTLITCGGAFDQRTRTFDKRLVVVARLLGSASE